VTPTEQLAKIASAARQPVVDFAAVATDGIAASGAERLSAIIKYFDGHHARVTCRG
jgi:hypothetical protein